MSSLLDSARTILTVVKNGWIPGHYAVDETGHDCEPWSDRASKWCAIGAIQAVAYYEDGEQANGPKAKLLHTIYDAANVGELLGNLSSTPSYDSDKPRWYGNTAMSVESTNDASSQQHAMLRMTRLISYIERKALTWDNPGHKFTQPIMTTPTTTVKPFGVKNG